MKLGAENRKKTIFATLMLVVAIALFARVWSNSSRPVAAAPDSPSPRTVAQQKARNSSKEPELSLDPRLRLDLLKRSENIAYAGTGRNIFALAAPPIPAPVAPGLTDSRPAAAPFYTNPGPPPPPPINLKFFGYASRSGETKKALLAQESNVFVAGERDIVARRYRVLRIAPNFVEIEDMLSNYRQSIPLTQR